MADVESRWREGGSSPSGGPIARGASAPRVKPGGDQEALHFSGGQQFSRIRKRSFKRAARRAQLQGETMYRGRKLVSASPLLPVVEEQPGLTEKHRIRFPWNVMFSSRSCNSG